MAKSIIPKKTVKKSTGAVHNTELSEVNSANLLRAMVSGYGENSSDEGKKELSSLLPRYLRQEVMKQNEAETYNILVLFDNTKIVKGDSDKIYTAINTFQDKTKPLLLVLVSSGGEPGSAYLIGKLCQEFCNKKFVVVVPRYAKSAATLLSCSANEIHMGSLSELGPIDPQIDGMPTLGLKNSIEHIAELASKNPGSGEMFARYLQRTVEPVQIGYYERVAESLLQYAEKLLTKHRKLLSTSPKEIAERLVYGYKDHGFVIDKEEAITIFGDQTIKTNTPEYSIGNTVYNILSKVDGLASNLSHNFYFIGSLDSTPTLWAKARK